MMARGGSEARFVSKKQRRSWEKDPRSQNRPASQHSFNHSILLPKVTNLARWTLAAALPIRNQLLHKVMHITQGGRLLKKGPQVKSSRTV